MIGPENRWFDDKSSGKRLDLFSEAVKSKGGKIVLFLPSPEFKLDIHQCKDEWFRPQQKEKCNLQEKELRILRESTYQRLNSLSEDLILYDPLDALCFDGNCPILDSIGRPLYFDKNHFTDFANREYITEHFIKFLRKKDLI